MPYPVHPESDHALRTAGLSIDEMRAVWDTKLFGVLAVYQAMLPLPLEVRGARIVTMSSGAGSLTRNSDPASAYRSILANTAKDREQPDHYPV